MTTTSLFAGLKDAKTFERGTYMKPGQYEVRIKRAIFKKTRAKGDAFILEFTVEKSNYDEAKRKAIGVGVGWGALNILGLLAARRG